MRSTFLTFLGILVSGGMAWGGHEVEGDEDGVKEGHSSHGEAFDEGPRQSAYLMEHTGDVHFEVTTSKPEAQKFFNQGIGQLHGFWYFEAERSFRQVLALDPDCAMAYWGMAMANSGNEKRAKGFIDKAVKAKDGGAKLTEWERMWIDATAGVLDGQPADKKQRLREHIKAVEGIAHQFPDHVEPKAFLCGMAYHYRIDVPISSYMAVDALLDQIFAVSPDHPAHHYRIHLWDAERPERALKSAAALANTARSTAHMWHMPGHIYDKLGRPSDAAWHQEAASRVDHGQMARNRVLPDQIHNYAHNQEWLIRSLMALGKAEQGERLAREMVEVPRHPDFNTLSKNGCAKLGRQRLVDVLEEFEKWDVLIDACGSVYLEETDDLGERLRHFKARVSAHFGIGDDAGLGVLFGELQKEGAEVEVKRDEEVKKMEETFKASAAEVAEVAEGAEQKSEEEKKKGREEAKKAHEKAVADVKKKYGNEIAEFGKVRDRIEMYRAALSKDVAKVEEKLKKDKLGALEKSRLFLAAGMMDKAVEEAKKAADEAKGHRVANLIQLVDVLEKAGKSGEADDALKRVLANSAEMDLKLPALAKIEGVLRRNGCDPGGDWRAKYVAGGTIMDPPELDTLGPPKWVPFTAETWSLPGADGQVVSLADYRGKPVVVIFYLGAGCLHCVEQLWKFAPKVEEFRKQGIEVVAIATDSKEELNTALEGLKREGEEIPIKLVSDQEMGVFRKFRAFDDFEGKALHGTFLIDGDGMIRWQDIGADPFMEVEFLLGEARRVLALRAGAGK